MTFREICDLFGGQTAVSRILGLKDTRDVRRRVKNNDPRPHWIKVLKKLGKEKISGFSAWIEDCDKLEVE